MIEVLSIISSVILLLVYALYFRQVSRGESTPNPVTWLSWSIASTINAITYFSVMEGDYWKSAIAIIANVSMILICLYSFYKGKFSKLNALDYFILVMTILIGIFWQMSDDDRLANILIQFIFIVSFIPTIYGLIKNTLTEKAFPWWLAVASYLIQILIIIISFSGDWLQLLFPIVNGILGNGSVAVLATMKSIND